jgi:hypothetical protein
MPNMFDASARSCTYVETGDGAGGVAGDELHLHVEAAEHVLVLGLEPGAGGPVHGQRHEVAAVHDLCAPIAIRDVHVLVEVAAAGHTGNQQHIAQNHDGCALWIGCHIVDRLH